MSSAARRRGGPRIAAKRARAGASAGGPAYSPRLPYSPRETAAEPIRTQAAVAKAMPATLSPLNARSSERPPGSSTAEIERGDSIANLFVMQEKPKVSGLCKERQTCRHT